MSPPTIIHLGFQHSTIDREVGARYKRCLVRAEPDHSIRYLAWVWLCWDELAASLGLMEFLDFTVTSGEVGAEKPSPPIFLKALDKAGASPEESIHVGDQLTSDIEGAEGVGINPVLLDRDGNHRGYTQHPRIEGLSELPDVLNTY